MLTRRTTLLMLAGVTAPLPAFSNQPRETWWEDLIPPGVPYSEIIGEGDIDYEADTWSPIYDANGVKLNEALDGALIRMPGYVVPLEFSDEGVTDFLLVPYVGACVHVPPPPANQLVLVRSEKPWPDDELWTPVWVTGTMRTQLSDTELGQTGYALTAIEMEEFVWE